MFGKQDWRLLTRENLLVGRVFKARYYHKGSFMDAELGTNPNYIWRSILESKVLLKREARWRVVDFISGTTMITR